MILALMVMTLGAWADGYRNPPMTAEAIGKSGNAIVFTDDASAIAYNPANLALQTNISFVVDVTFAHTEHTYKDGVTSVEAEADDPWQPLPNIFVSAPLGDSGIALGLGITTPYGQGAELGRTDLHDTVNSSNALYEARMALININPTIAFSIGDSLAIGVGADIIVSKLEFKQYYPWSLYVPFPVPDGVAEVDAYGYGFGGNIGATWAVTDKQKLAITYRSGFTVDYTGDFKVSNFPGPAPGTSTTPKSDFSTEIEFPNIIGVGYGIELTDTIRIEANFEWLEWSSNESLEIDLDNNQPLLGGEDEIPNDWDDTITVGVGGDWQIDENWVFRAGYAFIETPIPDETIAPILPDADRHAFSVGLGFQAGGHAIDVAYTYSIYDDREPKASENEVFPGSYDIDSDLLGLTYSLSF